jgi:putative protease
VILSRELSLDEIEEIRQRCPEMELEVFVHGALCIAYSGRCLLSGYFNHRDSNQGTCTNSCRWDYKVRNAAEDASGDLGAMQVIPLHFDQALEEANRPFSSLHQQPRHPLADQPYLIEEAGRPGQLLPILEDEHGTYIMNSKDLRAVEHVERLVKIGVNSLKVEGRTKSLYYAARTAQVYRHAIDDAVAGRPFDIGLLGQLQGLANRGYTDGFYQRHHTQAHQNYMHGASQADRSQYVGDVLSVEDGWARVEVKNRFAVGDRIEVIHPSGNRDITLTRILSDDGAPMQVAPGRGYLVRIELDPALDRALLARYL